MQQASDPAKLLDRRRLVESEGGSNGAGAPGDSLSSSATRVTAEPLTKLSLPPTDEELRAYEDVPIDKLPHIYKRDNSSRVFVNRDLRLDRIEHIGFDMDYTLADYTEAFEGLTFQHAVARLTEMGYPEGLKQLKYEPYALRGMFLDTNLGNFLKLDKFGHIHTAYHGSRRLSKKVIAATYPSMMVNTDRKRFHNYTTMFSVVEASVYAAVMTFLEDTMSNTATATPPPSSAVPHDAVGHALLHTTEFDLSYTNLHNDIRSAIDYIHIEGLLKDDVVRDIQRYIMPQPQLIQLLNRLRFHGAKLFLLTNSGYTYSNHVMTYLLKDGDCDWKMYFDYIIVGARKPVWFTTGTTLREVNLDTGNLKISREPTQFERGKVYNGGSMALFEKLTGASGNKVLYIGDHIFSDIIVSKKQHFWRTLLVVKELDHELRCWQETRSLYVHLRNLLWIKAETFRGLDMECTTCPEVDALKRHIKDTKHRIDAAFHKYFGPLLRSGHHESYFASQVYCYADLYTSKFTNLLNYPPFYLFSAELSDLLWQGALQH